MHMNKIKNKVVATTLATTIIASNAGSVIYADVSTTDNSVSTRVERDARADEAIIVAEDLYVELGGSADIMDGIIATEGDTNITDDVEVDGLIPSVVDTSRENRQTVMYKVVNSAGDTIYKSRDIYVVKKEVVENPTVEVDDKGVLTLTDKGVKKSFGTTKFSNSEWGINYYGVADSIISLDASSTVKQGDKVIASGLLNDVDTTSTTYTLDVVDAGALDLGVSVDGVGKDKVGRVLVDDNVVYDSETIVDAVDANDTYKEVSVDLEVGSHEIVFEFSKEEVGETSGDGEITIDADNIFKVGIDGHRMYIHSMAMGDEDLLEGSESSTKLQYSINNGVWLDYNEPVDLKGIANAENTAVVVNSEALFEGSLGAIESPSSIDGSGTVTVPMFVEPVITAGNVTLKVGDTFDVMAGVTATDGDGNDITSLVAVVNSNVDMAIAGTYNVTYEVMNKKGVKVNKTITVTVNAVGGTIGNVPILTLSKDTIELEKGTKFNALDYATANDVEDGVITNKIVVKSNNVNINVPGGYVVVYEVKDSDANVTTKTLNVIVKEAPKGTLPVITATDVSYSADGKKLDLLKYVTATDKEDGVLTSKVTVKSSNVDITRQGIYTVVYTVTDKDNNTVDKSIQFKVIKEHKKPVISVHTTTLMQGTPFNPMTFVKAYDTNVVDITDRVKVVTNNVNVDLPGAYNVVYEVTDDADFTTTQETSITVLSKNGATDETQKPVINATDIIIPLGVNMAYILEGVTANDSVDGIITNKIQVKNSNVDFNKEGAYSVTFSVTNSKGITAEKQIRVEVKTNTGGNNSVNGVNNTGNNSNGGSGEQGKENVSTFDNAYTYLLTFITSLVGSAGLFFKIKKRD